LVAAVALAFAAALLAIPAALLAAPFALVVWFFVWLHKRKRESAPSAGSVS
jgi:hypothetical protein